MSSSFLLPHGQSLQFFPTLVEKELTEGGAFQRVDRDGIVTYRFRVELREDLCVYSEGGVAPAELGLEIMAQAAGITLALMRGIPHPQDNERLKASESEARVGGGVVAAVRGYEFAPVEFRKGEVALIEILPEVVEDHLGVFVTSLQRANESTVSQRARVTLVIGK